MKIALLGYGKMGQEIEKFAQLRGHEVLVRATSTYRAKAEELSHCDMAIEFSRPDSAVDNILTCFEAKCPVVVGTTGWYGRLNEVKTACSHAEGTLLYASNFSIGVNVLFHINKELARIMNHLEAYDASMLEIHHTAKLDQPSGTAITLAEGILSELERKTEWVNEKSSNEKALTILSERIGEVPGTHEVIYESAVDRIRLVHEAKNRQGFVQGAVMAAEWLSGKKGIFTMHDFLKF
jgi:4-hydroxy-tetrahydrodipicolinate reductase